MAQNAEVIVISTDMPAVVKRTVDRHKLAFIALSDTKKEAVDSYNAADPFNPRIALPQFYIIDETGIVRWKFVDNRKFNRLQPDSIVDELKKL